MINMNAEQFYGKYGKDRVEFYSYYKYVFTFKGKTTDGCDIMVCIGNNHDDIYRVEITSDMSYEIISLMPFSGTIYKDGKAIEGFYDY